MNAVAVPAPLQVHDLIERWQNVGRVLKAMPEHERRQHWDMGAWGKQTECGTVACAAGHCGLDPWFRERGFTLDLVDGTFVIANPIPFFGAEGTTQIFLNTDHRPVEAVIEEVRAYTDGLRRIAALMAEAKAPAIGEAWPEQAGVYAGPVLGRDGATDYFLIVGPESEKPLNWHDANAWAAELIVGEHHDFALPFRHQQLVAFDRVRHLFERDWYWSCEQHASYSSLAWDQHFYHGYQDPWSKGYELRARAVRRLIIQ